MNSSRWFELDLSSSDPVKVTVSVVQQSSGGPTKVPIFEALGSSFSQKVRTGTGTYFVDIKNENLFSVTLDGKVLVQQTKETYRSIYPYVIPGFLTMLGGTGALIYGILKKPSKSKRTRVKKIKR